ncbi:hypothetical protein H7J86_24460 [Mycobacterium hackensackense]|uniref:hypothetical protein n=1 Tax=Mycobacterium hackensackense TaxID=228909 RepID=UPI002265B494|nr:hypothetical protein [Mycobacterium hackensackense]MCV7255321.1 hypothetical protein [Mycobacterium hackensackense]
MDDLLRRQPNTPDELRQFITDVVESDDLTDDEKWAVRLGYLAGLSYAVGRGVEDGATELLLRLTEWDE